VSWLLFTGLGALGLAVVVAAVALAGGGAHSAVAQTVKTADQRYRLPVAAANAPAGRFAWSPSGLARSIGRALTPRPMLDSLGRRLDQAGNPPWLAGEAVLGYKGMLLFTGAIVALALFVLVSTNPFGALAWTVVGAAAGFFAPDLMVLHLAQERQEEIRRTLPDVMDTLVITVEAGMGFEAALAQVVHNGRGPLVGEFARVLHEMQIGRPRVDALRDLATRTNVGELRAFSSAVVQATTLGIPMGKVLRQQSAEMRLRRRQRAEELAQKVPVKILFPMIFCIFPVLFVVVVGPGAIRIIEAFGR
jgi:Flp pilus assembly protein TadB